MEPLRKPHCSCAKQHQEIKEEPLLARSSESCCPTEGEVVVKIESNNHVGGKEIDENASKSNTNISCGKPHGSSKKFRVTFDEVINQAVSRRKQGLSDQENGHNSSNSSFSSPSAWKSMVRKTKSRLLDPPEEQYQRTESSVNNQAVFGDNLDQDHELDDIEDIPDEYNKMKLNALTVLQWVSLVFIIVALICSLSIPVIRMQRFLDLPLWKWELLVLALICGELVSDWGIRVAVIFIERSFLLRKRVLYFVYGLRKSVQNCLWLGLVLLVWHLIFDDKVKEETKSQILPYVTKILFCFFVGNLIWLFKTLIVKVLASSFHVQTFFERIQDALFHQYVIETLSGPPLFERHDAQQEEISAAEAQDFQNVRANTMPGDLRTPLLGRGGREEGSGKLQNCPTVGKNPRISKVTSKKQDEKIQINHLHKLNPKNISAWNMKRMIKIIHHGSLSTLDEQILNADIKDEFSWQIKSECQAKEAAKKIFHRVAKPGSQYIRLDDVMRFMDKDEALKTMHQIQEGCGDEGISISMLKIWVVNAFRERKALALSLNDTKTSVDELHNMLSILVAIIIAIIWLVILGIPIAHFLVFISSQLLLVVFIFGNTCKTVFEAIVFLFVIHPFDVGDHCEVDGIKMTVEEMNILSTVFLRSDNQKVTYPNSVLATKSIGNFHRSPDMMESIDFSIHISTPTDKISLMKERIIRYVQSKSEYWHNTPMVLLKDVDDMNRLKMMVWLRHRLNFENVVARWNRRGLVIEEIIKVCRELDIEYRMLPLDVNIRNMPALSSTRVPSNWTTCTT